ncbi:hypothetical protein PWT90_03076 [Aphanocladium album]|nr:hypothetical protein PWT90_03076 [Aphanocladium album]
MLHSELRPHRALRLRRVAVWTFPLAAVLFTLHGLASSDCFPFLGLLPLAVSATHSAMKMYPVLRPGALRNLPVLWSPHTTVLLDTGMAFLHGLVLLISIVQITTAYHYNTGEVMLGAYCTVFLIVVGSIHGMYAMYYVLRFVNEFMDHYQRLAALELKQQPGDAGKGAEKAPSVQAKSL